MKELDAINGIYNQMQQITSRNGYATNIGSSVFFGRGYYNDINDLPVVVVSPGESDSINNQLGPRDSTEFNITSPLIIECHVEADPESITPIYQAWRDITKAVAAWSPDTVSDRIDITYNGKTITYPDDNNRIAVLQVRFDINYIEDLTS